MKIRVVTTAAMEYLNTNQVAERFGVTRLTVMNWIYGGKLEALKIGGRWKVTEDALDEFTNTKPEWGATAQRLRTKHKIGRPRKPKAENPGPKYDRRKFKI